MTAQQPEATDFEYKFLLMEFTIAIIIFMVGFVLGVLAP